MCFQQRQPKPQTQLYSLSFSLKWWFYLYLLLSAKRYTNSLWEETCQWAPGAYGKGSLCPYMPGAIKNSLLSFSLLSPSNSPVSGFSPYITVTCLHFTGSSTPHISQASVHVDIFFHQTSVFIYLVSVGSMFLFVSFCLFCHITSSWLEASQGSGQGFWAPGADSMLGPTNVSRQIAPLKHFNDKSSLVRLFWTFCNN